MKKLIKNILLTFVIIFTILTLVRYSINIISRRIMLNEITTAYLDNNINIEGSMEVEKNAKESIEEIRKSYGEGVPATALVIFRSYILGMDLVLDSELTILLTTLILSISIGTIVSLTEKSKIKELIKFITGGILCVLLYTTIMYITGEYKDFKIFESVIETINSCGVYYIVAYLMKIIYTYCKNKKSVKELNKELENKNK